MCTAEVRQRYLQDFGSEREVHFIGRMRRLQARSQRIRKGGYILRGGGSGGAPTENF